MGRGAWPQRRHEFLERALCVCVGLYAAGAGVRDVGAEAADDVEFFDKYCDEGYAIIDAVDTAKIKKKIDVEKIREFLAEITADV